MARFLASLRTWWAARAKRRVIASLRRQLTSLGLDVSRLTDAEIETGTLRLANAVGKIGVSTDQAAQALQQLERAGHA